MKNVLVITGDTTFKPGHERFDLQASAVHRLDALYWGLEALWPRVPKGEVNVVTAQDPFFRGVVGWYIARRTQATFNVQVHADVAAQGLVKRLLARFVLARADSVRVVSEKVKAHIEKMTTAPIHVLPIFMPLERFRSVVRVPRERPLVLWIGRFEAEKDPLLATKVFAEVHRAVPEARMIMLGAGSLEERLKKAAAALPIEFPGWQDPLEYLAGAHVVLSTSRAESWGASIVETLAAGVPVVAPDVGVAKEAGAIVVERDQLAHAVVDVLKTDAQGELQLPILSREAWVSAWVKTL